MKRWRRFTRRFRGPQFRLQGLTIVTHPDNRLIVSDKGTPLIKAGVDESGSTSYITIADCHVVYDPHAARRRIFIYPMSRQELQEFRRITKAKRS